MVKGKLISKHPSVKILSHKQIKTTVYIKSKTPYISALKRVNKFLEQLQRNGNECVTVLGMGKATEKTLALACHFQEEKGKKVEVLTQSVEVLDEVLEDQQSDGEEIDDLDKETKLQKRIVSGIKLRIYP